MSGKRTCKYYKVCGSKYNCLRCEGYEKYKWGIKANKSGNMESKLNVNDIIKELKKDLRNANKEFNKYEVSTIMHWEASGKIELANNLLKLIGGYK